MAFLSVSGVSRKERDNYVVKDINFTQNLLQKVVVAGETGSGKTTLLKMIAGWIQPTSGEIIFQQKRVLGPEEHLMPGHPGIGYLSQHFELRNNYRVQEVLEYANQLPPAEAQALYTVCRIEHLLRRRTDQLSGGEKQRIALARLLTDSPKLLLLDEPFSNLDSLHKRIMKAVIEDLGAKLGITCLMVLHEAADILSWADRILVMKGGKIIQHGTPEHIYRQPVNEYCAGLFGSYNLLDAALAASLAASPIRDNSDGRILVRPEHFQLTLTEEGVKGIVQSSLFWGNYFTIDVWIEDRLLRVQTKNNNLAPGDIVYISADPGQWVRLTGEQDD